MGQSASLLDESKSNFIKGRTQADLDSFAPIYRKQYLLAFLSHIHDEQVQRKEEHTQLLKQRERPPESDVLYMGKVLNFTDNRKWKQRFAVVRASYSLECHESFESFEKGTPPLHQLLPTGGTIFTTEEKYMEMVDKYFPNTNDERDDLAPPADTVPENFPVYLRLPYRRDHYFCFQEEDKQEEFISILSDCIRHQNHDFLKKKNYEVQAFVRAVQFYRQAAGRYELWDMLIGSDARVLANLTMEKLLPMLGKDLLSGLKGKKSEKRRMWFAAVEEMYYLVQRTLMDGMATVKKECREAAEKHAALIRSDMDQIMSSRAFVEAKLRATVGEAAETCCAEQVEPHLPALLEEVMGPVSRGFMEARQLSDAMMERLCQDYQEGAIEEELQEAWEEIRSPDLQSCYDKVSGLRDHIQELQQRFTHASVERLEQRTQIDIEQLVENMAYTFELFLHKAKENKINIADAMMKAKHRVLKQYDYDSSTVRKRIFQEALLNITLPCVKAHLAPQFKNELSAFEQYIFADYVNFINVENVYEDILQQVVGDEISKVVKEAASMKKYNLFTESRFQFSTSSMHSSPPGSKSSSPAHATPVSPPLGHSPAGQALVGPGGSAAEQKQPNTCMVSEVPSVASSTPERLANGTSDSVGEREPDPVASFPSGTPLDRPGSDHTESSLIKPAMSPTERGSTLSNPVLRALESVTNRRQNSAGWDTRLLKQAALTNENSISSAPVSRETENAASISVGSVLKTASCDRYSKGTVTAPPSGVEKWSNPAAETKAIVNDPFPLRAPDDEIKNSVDEEDDEEAVDNTEERDVGAKTALVLPQLDGSLPQLNGSLPQPDGSLVARCDAVPDVEVRAEAEAMAALASLALCLADSSAESPNPNSSSPAEGATEARPAPTPTPPDCIKEIRDLVVEVIEVEDMIQRYPDNGET
ncbi:protein Niban 1a [Brachyhypopomus gauderio]|uniref:protein Niban 1a n=1 Tax=Brachyhypopomus gauderio TaxID=698409 RepID=UPI0040417E45